MSSFPSHEPPANERLYSRQQKTQWFFDHCEPLCPFWVFRLGDWVPFFCFFKSLVPFRGFCLGNVCSMLGDVSCNWVELGEPFGSCSNNSVQFFLPQQFLQNPEHRNFRQRFPEDHGRLRPPSLSIPCLGNGFGFVFTNFGSCPREWFLSQSSSPTPSWASVSTSLRGFPSPSPEGPKTWKIFQGIFSVKLNLWFPSKQFGTPQEICAKNV